jgi:hypothetical protein
MSFHATIFGMEYVLTISDFFIFQNNLIFSSPSGIVKIIQLNEFLNKTIDISI